MSLPEAHSQKFLRLKVGNIALTVTSRDGFSSQELEAKERVRRAARRAAERLKEEEERRKEEVRKSGFWARILTIELLQKDSIFFGLVP